MKNKYIQTALLVLSLTYPLATIEANKAHCDHEHVTTDAGNIDFQLVKAVKASRSHHSIAQIHPKENVVEFKDGSQWNVSKSDVVQGWAKNDHLVITQNQATFSTYRFALVNPELKLAVPISLLREPMPSKEDCLFLKEMDKTNDLVTLNDKTRWIVHSSDTRNMNKMIESHRIIIGVNSGEDHERCPYILIDATNNTYVRARMI